MLGQVELALKTIIENATYFCNYSFVRLLESPEIGCSLAHDKELLKIEWAVLLQLTALDLSLTLY